MQAIPSSPVRELSMAEPASVRRRRVAIRFAALLSVVAALVAPTHPDVGLAIGAMSVFLLGTFRAPPQWCVPVVISAGLGSLLYTWEIPRLEKLAEQRNLALLHAQQHAASFDCGGRQKMHAVEALGPLWFADMNALIVGLYMTTVTNQHTEGWRAPDGARMIRMSGLGPGSARAALHLVEAKAPWLKVDRVTTSREGWTIELREDISDTRDPGPVLDEIPAVRGFPWPDHAGLRDGLARQDAELARLRGISESNRQPWEDALAHLGDDDAITRTAPRIAAQIEAGLLSAQ